MELDSLSRITARRPDMFAQSQRAIRSSSSPPLVKHAIDDHCDSVPGVSHYRAIIGGEAIKLRGGPSFNFDESTVARQDGDPPNGGPLMKTPKCNTVLTGSGVLVGWRAKDPCLQMETVLTGGQTPMPLRNGQLNPLKLA